MQNMYTIVTRLKLLMNYDENIKANKSTHL